MGSRFRLCVGRNYQEKAGYGFFALHIAKDIFTDTFQKNTVNTAYS